MLKDLIPSRVEISIEYALVFDDGHNNGYAFPCDEHGNLQPLSDAGLQSLAFCRNNSNDFQRSGEVVVSRIKNRIPAHGICICGEEVYLTGSYFGATSCPNCNRWYNTCGQELLPPDEWIIDPSDEEYW